MNDVLMFLAESGIDWAKKHIATEIMSAGRNSISTEDSVIAVRYLNDLANKGDDDALLALGALYYTGAGDYIEQDYSKALYYYEKAAEKSELNEHWALNNLGYCYYYGRACEVDYKKAYSCFALAAAHGNSNAMYKLGDMYYYGNYVDKDIDASFYWYSYAKAIDNNVDDDYQGFLTASIAMRLGRAYLYGEGTEIDLFKALFELRLAEILFYKQILMNDSFSIDQLPKVKQLLKETLEELDEMIN